MKELIIEDKAKRYDESIKIAKSKIKNDKDHVLYEDDIIEIFPELKESEDEKIRNEIIKFLELPHPQFIGKRRHKDWIAWLEKQCESVEINPTEFDTRLQGTYQAPDEIIEECYQDNADHIIDIVTEQEKPSEWSEEDEKIMSTIMKEGDLKPSERKWLKSLKDKTQSKQSNKPQGKSALEAINEETVDNSNKIVNAKFKVGDWIVVRGEVILICDIRNDLYDVIFADGEHRLYNTNILDKESHLWTIDDAKEGDVLISWTNKPFIYNGFFNESVVGAYCGLNTFNRIIIADKQDYLYYNWTIKKHVKPAIKEQRDFLFKKIEDKGYEWDNEKKLLKN